MATDNSTSAMASMLAAMLLGNNSIDSQDCPEDCPCRSETGGVSGIFQSLMDDMPSERGSGISSYSHDEGVEYFFELPGVGDVNAVTVEITPPTRSRGYAIKVMADRQREGSTPYRYRYATELKTQLDPNSASVTLEYGLLSVKFANRELPPEPAEPIRVPVTAPSPPNPAED